METKLFKIFASLGIPGVALGVFYLLLKGFGFNFSTIDPTWTAIIALVFLLIVGGVTIFALGKWAPERNGNTKNTNSQSEEYKKLIETEIKDNYQKIKNISDKDHQLPNAPIISSSQANAEIARHVKIELWKDLRSKIPSGLYGTFSKINMYAEAISVQRDDVSQQIKDVMLIDNAKSFVEKYEEYFG